MSAELLTRPQPAATTRTERAARGGAFALLLGALLMLAVSLPVYRLLSARETGLAGQATVLLADAYHELFLSGLLLLLPAALFGSLLISDGQTVRAAQFLERTLLRATSLQFAAAAALVAAVLTAAFTYFVLGGLPNHIDSLAQTLHARFWADGRLAGPDAELGAFWMIQNSLYSAHGWVSQYPPGHVAVLALGILLGVPAFTGALLVGALVFVASLLAERLFPEQRSGARLGVILLATSPFLIALGGSYMNHITVALALTGAAYALVRVSDGGNSAWAVLAGFLLAWSFATRPLAALAAGAALLFTTLRLRLLRRPALAGALVAGAAPAIAALFAYNVYFFGSPFRFGYQLALGPNSGLGLQRDPWGNFYGVAEAFGYTSADLVSLNVALLESPLPAVLLVAVFLLCARRIERGTAVLLGWSLAPVAANLLYWHHGQFMGPRMLYEAAPAWLLLTGVSAVSVARVLPERIARAPRFALRSAYAGALGFALLAGVFYLAPARAASYGGGAQAVTRTPLPDAPAHALVFVHDAWRARVAMRLAASGMRLDSVEVAVRLNPTCTAQRLADAIDSSHATRRDALLSAMDFRPRGRDLPQLAELSPGNGIVLDANAPLTGDCLQQAYSDRLGVLDIAPLLWRGALVGSDDARPLFVRDLGPELNARMRAAAPQRAAYVYTLTDPARPPVLLPYDEGMMLLWGTTP